MSFFLRRAKVYHNPRRPRNSEFHLVEIPCPLNRHLGRARTAWERSPAGAAALVAAVWRAAILAARSPRDRRLRHQFDDLHIIQ